MCTKAGRQKQSCTISTLRNSVQLRHELNVGAEGTGEWGNLWLNKGQVAQTAFYSFLLFLFLATWLGGENTVFLASFVTSWSFNLGQVICWDSFIKVLIQRPAESSHQNTSFQAPSHTSWITLWRWPQEVSIFSSQFVNHHLKYNIVWKKSPLLKIFSVGVISFGLLSSKEEIKSSNLKTLKYLKQKTFRISI